ncbi:MAG: asparagine synthase-related protein [Candidatus Wallbacteria bacterium]|nr:asparagine synthase-related protein [Candidatus Wallbacteria bacterium]
MLDTILHRGPDGNTVNNFPWGTLGFCRLNIFGKDGINQPAVSDDGKTAVLFNGEIYNFSSLKELLPAKQLINDEAELILQLYQQFGTDCFKKLKGMFAIVILAPDKIILARDPLGIKPLVYETRGHELHFASEIKALLKTRATKPEIDIDSLAETSVLGFIFSLDKTMFQGINQVIPGSILTFDGKNSTVEKYYLPQPSFYGSESWETPETVERFRDLMESAAQLYLSHSKTSQAIYLSGGLDSTLMALFLQENAGTPLESHTLFDDPGSEDMIYAGKVAEHIGTHHLNTETGREECLELLDHYLYHYESLVTDGVFNVLGSLAFHILSRKIGFKHKVAYCGEGADELFGGYYWLHAHPLGLGDRLRARASQVNRGKTRINEFIQSKFPDNDSMEDEMRQTIFDMLIGPGLANCHLWSVDRSCSAFSFEARPLYLYDDIRDWALFLPINDKISSDLNTKLILKNFALNSGDELLYQVSARKKIGMPSALDASLKLLTKDLEKKLPSGKIKSDLPHFAYESYLHTDLEKLMFDKFYKLFIA